jgi:uncharacterized protein
MPTRPPLLIFGASARAAAFSALRAGLQPWCADLFADIDLQARCPAMRLPGHYPEGFEELAAGDVPGPWLYTGGLENWPALVERMARRRGLWGNDEAVLARVRHPGFVCRILREAGLAVPAVAWQSQPAVGSGRWLAKPTRGAGGAGIRVYDGPSDPESKPPPEVYYQEYIIGESWSAQYVADGQRAILLGVTRQLVGESWLRAAPFHYCGSIGPLHVLPDLQHNLERLGTVLTEKCELRGLFGVDGVVCGGEFWPVEVNPRYTASIEVLEYATGLQALAWHRAMFDGWVEESPVLPPFPGLECTGKAILFARQALVFPAEGPWQAVLDHPGDIHWMPTFADIPAAGQRIEAGRPILTLFGRGEAMAGCLEALQRRAADVERWLYRGKQRTV